MTVANDKVDTPKRALKKKPAANKAKPADKTKPADKAPAKPLTVATLKMGDSVECSVKLSDLAFDPKHQMRVDLPGLDDYTQVIKGSRKEWKFPPIEVAKVAGKLYVVDGFTRGNAAKAAGLDEVPCVVTKMTAAESMARAFQSNSTNGYNRTYADKRKAVLQAYRFYGTEATNRELARRCAVSHTFVAKVLKEFLSPETGSTEPLPEGRPAAVEPVDPKPAIDGLTDNCPNCSLQEWYEAEDGVRCRRCDHVHGEPAGDKDEVVSVGSAAATATPGAAAKAAAKAPAAAGPATAPVNTAPVNLGFEDKKKAVAACGTLVRFFAKYAPEYDRERLKGLVMDVQSEVDATDV